MSLRLINQTVTIFVLLLTGCASFVHETEKAVYYDAAYDDHNRAPASFNPENSNPSDESKLDSHQIRTQADYYFSMGEAQSYEGQHQKAIESFKMVLVYDQDSSNVHMRIAAEYIKIGLISQALEYAELAVSKDPKNIDAHLLAGGLFSATKVYDKAFAQYEMILKINPENSEAPLYIGAIYAEQKKYDKAVKYFESLLKKDDYQTPHLAYYYIARVRSEQGGKQNLKLAEMAYRKALEQKAEHIDSVLGLGSVYTKLEQEEKAVLLYKNFQKERGPSLRVAEVLSQIYLEQEKYELAFEQFEIMENHSEDALNIKVKMALILIEQKKYKPAIEKLQEVLAQVPDSDKIRFYLAAVYEEVNQPSKAIEHFEKVPHDSQFYGEAIVHATYLYKHMKKPSEAMKLTVKALDARPDIPQFYTIYASLLDEKQEYKKALQILNVGTEKFPDNAQLRFFLGTIFDKIGDKKSVVENMKKVIEMDPNHVQGLNYLAYTYSEMNTNFDEAEILVRRALEIEPKDAFVMDTYGWILFKKGKTSEAIKTLESAYRMMPTESIIAEHLGDVYLRAQMPDRARTMYERAVEFEADEGKVRDIRSKITSIDKQDLKKENRLPASLKQPIK